MVSDVQGVNDFSDVLPYILKITCMGRELCNHAQYHLGNMHMQCVPGRGSGCFATFRLSKWHMVSYDKMIFCQSVLD